MKIISKKEASQLPLPIGGGAFKNECTKQLYELIGEAKPGEAVFVERESWTRKTFPNATDLRRMSGRDVSVRTLRDQLGWAVFVM